MYGQHVVDILHYLMRVGPAAASRFDRIEACVPELLHELERCGQIVPRRFNFTWQLPSVSGNIPRIPVLRLLIGKFPRSQFAYVPDP